MKKILVPVNFSHAASNAADYAIDLAYNIGARVELLHVFQIPAAPPFAEAMVLPYGEYNILENDAKKALHDLVNRVVQKYNTAHRNSDFKPEVTGRSVHGKLEDEVYDYFAAGKMNLAIVGLNTVGKLSRILIGSNAAKMIARGIPLLLIPATDRFKKPKRIAFATDLSHSDIPVLCALAEFAKPFNADILITHTGNTKSDPMVYKQSVEDFLNRVADRVNYRNIYYRHVNSERVKDGLDWVVENGNIDILAMVHRKHSFFYRLLKGSYTMKMSDHIQVPLMVLPPEHNIPM